MIVIVVVVVSVVEVVAAVDICVIFIGIDVEFVSKHSLRGTSYCNKLSHSE